MRKKIPQIPITQVTENGFTYWVADPHLEEYYNKIENMIIDQQTQTIRKPFCSKDQKNGRIINQLSADQYHAANLKLNRLKVGLSIVILLVGLLNLMLQIWKR